MSAFSRLLTFTLVTLLLLVVAGNALRWAQGERSLSGPLASPTDLATPPATRSGPLLLLNRGTLVVSGLALVVTVILVFTGALRPPAQAETRAPFTARERERRSLSLLAATSARAQEELSLERDERQKAEADSRERLQLLNQALEEKIRIGRDLHDGVIQSLYAAGLTLESAQRVTAQDPVKAADLVKQSLGLINRTIVEIRSYIQGLSPRSVRGGSLAAGLAEIVEELRAGRPLDVIWRVDDAAVAELSDQQVAESLQITREAVSNALRHGGAGRMHISVTSGEQGTDLMLRDDGTGFNPAELVGPGLGLANMQARAEQALGIFTLTSVPGEGTSVHIAWQTARIT